MRDFFKFILIPWLVIAISHPASAQVFNTSKDTTTTRAKEKPPEPQKTEKPVSESASGKPAKEPPKEDSIEVSASQVEQDSTKDMIIARHKVVVRYKTQTVRADYIRINMTTGAGEAVGHVFIQDEDGTRIKGERGVFNLKSDKAKLFGAQGELPCANCAVKDKSKLANVPQAEIVDRYYVKGEEFQKIGEDHFKATKSSLTTCKGALPDWLLEVDSVDLKVGDRAYFEGGTFKIRGVPVMHFPVGYLPLDNTRKSGFLMPSFGSSNKNGFTFNGSYYWAINDQSDATAYIDYLQKRGVKPGLEYRYNPTKDIKGEITTSFIDDKVTNHTFYKALMTHQQTLPDNLKINAKLDMVDRKDTSQTFVNNPLEGSRGFTDSFLQINKNWANNSLDFLTRYQKSGEVERDDKFALLPQINHKLQRTQLGQSGLYFNQETSYSLTQTDLNPLKAANQDISIHRFDIHPQISMPFQISWLSLTPTVGARETYYSKGVLSNNTEVAGFTRESFDINTVLEGPKFNKTYDLNSDVYPKLNHLIEPRFTYQYIPDMDGTDRNKIKRFDAVDFAADPGNRITYSLIQRALRKKVVKENETKTDEILRFEVSQSYDIREAGLTKPNGVASRPFSDVMFRLDSRPRESLMLNAYTTYGAYDDALNSINFEVGVKPTDRLMMFLERRYTRNQSTFISGTIDWTITDGMRLQYSSRYDELLGEFRENNVSFLYDDPCKCWGLSFDLIKRHVVNGGVDQDETKFMFGVTLRGLGSLGTQQGQKPKYRAF